MENIKDFGRDILHFVFNQRYKYPLTPQLLTTFFSRKKKEKQGNKLLFVMALETYCL